MASAAFPGFLSFGAARARVGLGFVALATASCVTPTANTTANTAANTAANPATTPTARALPTPPGTPASTTTPASSEVIVLRERVARLEKRLADVDARLGLLLARAGDGGPASRPPLRFDAPRGEQRAIDLGSTPTSPAAEGLASVDIERGNSELPPIVDAAVEAAGGAEAGGPGVDAVEDAGGDDGGEAPRLVLRGTPGPASGDDDPLAALTSAGELYEWGQTRRREGRLLEAIAAFEDVVGRFPRDALADNAVYWIGQCHQARGDHRLALSVWQKLPLRFPRSAKIPDALFGMGLSHEALGEPALAEVLYDEVVQSYPKAEKRNDARKALQRLRPGR